MAVRTSPRGAYRRSSAGGPGVRLAALRGGALGLAVGLAASPEAALAHGFGQRYDLPVPLELYMGGAGAAVALSFVVIGLFLRGTPGLGRYPRVNLLRWRAGRLLVHPVSLFVPRAASVALLALVVAAGLGGSSSPAENLAPTLVWVVWWVGVAYVSALAGNVWALVNPWKVAFEWAEAAYRRVDPGGELSLGFPYSRRLGAWPGFALFLAFAWAELVYGSSAVPQRIAQMAIFYSAVTWTGMLLFGKEVWLGRGEAFSLAFGFLARFAPTERRVTGGRACRRCPVGCRDRDGECIDCGDCFRRAEPGRRELNLRPFAVGLLRNERVSTSMMAFVVLLLATVTFDGFTATPAWAGVVGSLSGALPGLAAVQSLGLVAFPAIFIGVYLSFSVLMSQASGNRVPVGDVARAFVYSLVPIALAYHLAHYLSYLLIQGQLILPVASDPFGFGWDLFGTAGWRPNVGVVNARAAWLVAVAAIVIGHVIAVYLAHVVALRVLREPGPALRSQYPMVALMVGYTMVSLWIVAQPIVEVAAA